MPAHRLWPPRQQRRQSVSNRHWSSLLTVIGRSGLASLFMLGGINKLMTYSETQTRMADVGLVPTNLLLPATIALELMGGLSVAYGRRPAIFAAAALSVFTLATNVWFHRFWTMSGEMASLELSLFFKNVAIAGALLFVLGSEIKRLEQV